jgi:hypothetical protein
MRKFKQVVLISLAAVTFFSCKEEQEPDCQTEPAKLRVTVQPVFGSETLYLDSVYSTVEGYDVKFTDLKFYMENPRNGSAVLIDAGLFDYRERGTLLMEGEGSYLDYSSMNANLGVHSSINHNDPAAFDNASMLNIANSNDMHWGWNPGYIFVKVEAKVDTIADANPLFDHNVVFHIGKDENFQTLTFSDVNWSDQGSHHELPLKLDMETFLQNGAETIDLKNEYTSHTAAGQEVLSMKVMVNFKAALTPY